MDNKIVDYDILKIEQGSREWLMARCGRITGSDAHILFTNGRGTNNSIVKENYAQRLAYEFMYGDPLISDISVIKQVGHGSEFEPFAISEYEEQNNCTVDRVGFLSVERGEYAGFLGCSPDGLIGNDGMIEVKCPFNQEKHLSFFYEGMNEKDWIIQCRFNMFVADRLWIDFVSYDPRRPNIVRLYKKRIHRCEKWDLELVEKIHELGDIISEKLDIWINLNKKDLT